MERTKGKLISIVIIIIVTAIILLIIHNKYLDNTGNIIYYDYLFVVTCHAPSVLDEYIIYDSGIIEQYSQKELVSTKKITKEELKELRNLIENVSKDFVTKEGEKDTYIYSAHRVVERYVYNKKNEKISLYDIEADGLKKLETYTENLKKQYCTN